MHRLLCRQSSGLHIYKLHDIIRYVCNRNSRSLGNKFGAMTTSFIRHRISSVRQSGAATGIHRDCKRDARSRMGGMRSPFSSRRFWPGLEREHPIRLLPLQGEESAHRSNSSAISIFLTAKQIDNPVVCKI